MGFKTFFSSEAKMRKKPKINILWAELVYLLTPRDEMPDDVLVNGKVGALEPLTKSRDHLDSFRRTVARQLEGNLSFCSYF
jgi:hypothetical protein